MHHERWLYRGSWTIARVNSNRRFTHWIEISRMKVTFLFLAQWVHRQHYSLRHSRTLRLSGQEGLTSPFPEGCRGQILLKKHSWACSRKFGSNNFGPSDLHPCKMRGMRFSCGKYNKITTRNLRVIPDNNDAQYHWKCKVDRNSSKDEDGIPDDSFFLCE